MIAIPIPQSPCASATPSHKHSLLPLDQWVKTELQGTTATGRVVSLFEQDGVALYEVELPLHTRQGGMLHVMRRAEQLHACVPGP